MKNSLLFKFIVFDSVRLLSESPLHSVPFFTDNSSCNTDSVTGIEEQQIARWLFEQSMARNLLLTELAIKQKPFYKLAVKGPIINGQKEKPGDIDILICEIQEPHKAIAIECKRVKVTTMDIENDKVNKISNVGNGVQQANSLRELGFHRTYLAILIETAGGNRKEYNILYRGSSLITLEKVYDFSYRDNLHKDVGVIFIEITQPTGKYINNMAVVGICIDKEAGWIEQSSNLTNRINELLSMG
jgi:hypothetical protein